MVIDIGFSNAILAGILIFLGGRSITAVYLYFLERKRFIDAIITEINLNSQGAKISIEAYRSSVALYLQAGQKIPFPIISAQGSMKFTFHEQRGKAIELPTQAEMEKLIRYHEVPYFAKSQADGLNAAMADFYKKETLMTEEGVNFIRQNQDFLICILEKLVKKDEIKTFNDIPNINQNDILSGYLSKMSKLKMASWT